MSETLLKTRKNLRTLLLLCACLFVVTCLARSDTPALSYRASSSAPHLSLPHSMSAALQHAYSTFRPYDLSHYKQDLVHDYEFTPNQGMYVVLGDFNGDTIRDAIIDGSLGRSGVRLALLSREEEYTAAVIDSYPRGIPADTYLILLVRGTPSLDSTCTAPLDRDSFGEVISEKGGTLYYYKNRKFVACTLSD